MQSEIGSNFMARNMRRIADRPFEEVRELHTVLACRFTIATFR